jgi:rhodanese-related sulfurtransferase
MKRSSGWRCPRLTAAGLLAFASLPLGAWAGDGVDGQAAGQLSGEQHQISPGILLAGKLYPGALELLDPAETLILDLRTPAEGTADEAVAAEQRGILYRNVPVAGAGISADDLDAVAAVLAEAGSRTVVVHCATGNRAGMIWGGLQLRRGLSLATVMADLDGVVTMPPIHDALARFAATLETTGGRAN